MRLTVMRSLALLGCGAVLISGLAMVSTKAIAAIQVPESNPGLLSLWTDSYPLEYHDMDPGESAYVRLNVQLDDTDRGALSLEVRRDGDLATVPGGLQIDLERCDLPWTAVPSGVTTDAGPVCSEGRTALLSTGAADTFSLSSPTWDLGEITNSSTVFLMVALTIPADTPPSRVDGLDASFGFGLFAEGVEVTTPITTTGLAFTGVDALAMLLVALGAIGAGIVVSRARSREVRA